MESFGAAMQSQEFEQLAGAIEGGSTVPPSSALPHIDQEALLELLCEARSAFIDRTKPVLRSFFVAADVNGTAAPTQFLWVELA